MTNRWELADRLEGMCGARFIDEPHLPRFSPEEQDWLTEAARLLREPVAGEVLEALEKIFAHTDEMATAHIMRARVQSVILRARLDAEGKGK